MDPERVLVVYYSRTGTTREVARAIREELGCEIERIADRTRRTGILGYLRSGFDATFRRTTVLHRMLTVPNDYDLVIVGTPIWNASVSTPVQTYLETNRDRFKRIAFFCTQGGRGGSRAFRQMEASSGKSASATLVVNADEVQHREFLEKVRRFVFALKTAKPTPIEPSPPISNLRPVPT